MIAPTVTVGPAPLEARIPEAGMARRECGSDWPGAAALRVLKAIEGPEYARAESRVIRQTAEALLFEGVLRAEESTDPSGAVCFRISGRTAGGAPVSYLAQGRRRESFGRYRLDAQAGVIRTDASGANAPAQLREFLVETATCAGVAETVIAGFLDELERTLVNEAAALRPGVAPDAGDDATGLEARFAAGHPYHPSFKSRVGFDPVDNAAYAPEFAPGIRPVWLAIRRDAAQTVTCRDTDYDTLVRGELGEEAHARFTGKLRAAGLAPEDYHFMPAHPWHWREKLLGGFAASARRRELVTLGTAGDLYRPLQSLRSLANVTRPRAPHLKMPLGIVNTSASRILSQHNVLNGPRVSDWLADIVAGDDELRASGLIVLRETAGITIREREQHEFLREREYGMLGAVWRENLDARLHPDETAAPFFALAQNAPDGVAFIAPWIARHGLLPWIDALLDATLPPLLRLMVGHGVALEAHGQNLALTLRDGLPARLAVKDLPGGLWFSRAHLSAPDALPRIEPAPAFRRRSGTASGMEVEDAATLRDNLFDCLFFINFTDLALRLREGFGLNEADFWKRVSRRVRAWCAAHPEYGCKLADYGLFAPVFRIESLASKRLFPGGGPHEMDVPNPLFVHRADSGGNGS